MPDQGFQDKTEPATQKRREEARKKGQVAKSRELSSVAVLAAGLVYLFFAMGNITLSLGDMIRQLFLRIPLLSASDHNLISVSTLSVKRYLEITLPILIALALVALVANLLQTGFLWSVESLAPKASKINPFEGAKRIFSKRSFAELAKSVAKVIIVGWAAFSTLMEEFDHLIPLLYQEKIQILTLLGQAALKVVTRCCWVLAILAILDYLYQKWEFEQNLKMTKQEVKDEFRQTEGDPIVKSRIRSIQREMARRRMMEEVPKADVVITNPTRLAVALRYDPGTMTAPKVVAKGANKLAQRIRELAAENLVPVVENKILAQNLYQLEIGEEIPPPFYQAAAEVLAYVYGLKNGRRNKG